MQATPSRPRRRLDYALVALAAAFAVPQALAQAWPTKPVTLVVGTPAGGSVDVYARTLAEQLARQTGGTFLVDNRPGANGNISADYVARAPADGHMFWMTTQAMMTINPSAYSDLKWKQSDFVPIAKGIESPLVLVTHPSVPARSLDELGKWVAANPGKAAYASFSPGTPSSFLGFQLSERLKLNMVHVPYKGSAPQVTDLLSGQVSLGFTQLQAALPHVKAGKLNAIATTAETRTPFLPQVPTLAELGHKDLSSTVWFGVAVRAGTPPAVASAITDAVVKAQASPEYRAKLEAQGFDVPKESGEAFAKSIATETARWAAVIKATGFRASN
jgi:tripartite-type tricarboxylate transporter receptor subunit TctC